MEIRNPTDEEAQQIIHGSLNNIFAFEHEPDEPGFLEEVIRWDDILAIPPVNKTFLRTNLLVAAEVLLPGSSPNIIRSIFFEHLDNTAQETVEEYREFLKIELILH